VDGVLIVVCPRKTSQTATVDILDRMDRAGVRPLGIILNQVKSEDGDGYYQVIKNYDHFSYEQSQPKNPKVS
jgi:Mrp family chromosome partitioning ATPase